MSEFPVNPEFELIGGQLRSAREAKGLSPEVVAERLHCDPKVLMSLESGSFGALGAPVFVRGHLKRYAELLGQPVDEILAQWSVANPVPPQTSELARGPQSPRPLPGRQWGRAALVIVAAALLALVVWWILRGNATTALVPSRVSPAVAVALPPLPEPEPEPVQMAPPTSPTQPVAADPVPAALPAAASGADSTAPSVAAPDAARSAVRLPLVAAFSQACWVDIADASGKRLYYGMAPAGSRVQVAGAAPLKVILGNPAAARLQVDGRSVVVPQGPAGMRSARFVVSSGGELRAL